MNDKTQNEVLHEVTDTHLGSLSTWLLTLTNKVKEEILDDRKKVLHKLFDETMETLPPDELLADQDNSILFYDEYGNPKQFAPTKYVEGTGWLYATNSRKKPLDGRALEDHLALVNALRTTQR